MSHFQDFHVYFKSILKLIAEYEIDNLMVFQGIACKVRVYESSENHFFGRSNIFIKRKDTGELQCPDAEGSTVDETLQNTLENILSIAKEYRTELQQENIAYRPYYDF